MNNIDEITPTRKRKRETNITENATTQAVPVSCFTNAAFSSTPKKVFGKRRTRASAPKENLNPFMQNAYLEVKSVADITRNKEQFKNGAVESQSAGEHQSRNPYEVQRKPPKKKKRQNDIEDACFENPALNLEVPEKQFNPYEVIRSPQKKEQCFVNEALNIRGQDQSATRNPFEIQRDNDKVTKANVSNGIENPCMNNAKCPSTLKIGLPFTPTLGCRIDFKNMSLSQLTPSCKDLVFSPVALAKRSLGSISEEESSLSIGKELDRYQLELENSINEAKLRKNCVARSPDSPKHNQQQMHFKLELENKITFTQKLEEIAEAEEDENENVDSNLSDAKTTSVTNLERCLQEKQQIEGIITYDTEHLNVLTIENENITNNVSNDNKNALQMKNSISNDVIVDNDDVAYASESDEDDIDFKVPAPFVRAYRTAKLDNEILTSKESLNSNGSEKANDDKKLKSSVKNAIRNSLRKLMHPSAAKNAEQLNEKITKEEHNDKLSNVIQHIRLSLRRKTSTKPLHGATIATEHEISIIDTSERTMKFKSNETQIEYLKIEDLSNEKRKNTLRSSLRQTTRDMMQTVFHKKQEGYALNK